MSTEKKDGFNNLLNFSFQETLIQKSIKEKVPLKKMLEENCLNYSDLRYSENLTIKPSKPNVSFSSFLPLSEEKIPIVSFFSGAGGLDLGFEKANFETKVFVENNKTFCETLRLNFPGATIIGPPDFNGDMSDPNDISTTLTSHKISKNFNGVFIGGPPCQPFSVAANQRFKKSSKQFKRVGFNHLTNGTLLFDFVNLIVEFKPRVFLIENVPGLLKIDGGKQLKLIYSQLKNKGYFLSEPLLLEASNYGVPQYRKRLFILGSRDREFNASIPLQPKLERTIDHIFDVDSNCSNNETRQHVAQSVQRYMYMKYGEREKLGRVDRLDPFKPSKTIIAGGSGGGGRSHLHPIIPRTLSPRECARLQTFPDDFKFCGSNARQFNQIGNAVPPLLAAQIAEHLVRPLFNK